MTNQPTFGAQLRLRRTEKGLSLAALAASVNYSKSHLSKIESGVKSPSTALARQCDRVLGAAGVLARLAPVRGRGAAPPESSAAVPPVLATGRGGPVDLPAFQAFLRDLRASGQSTTPAAVLPIGAALTDVVGSLAAAAPTADRAPAFRLAARFAEYTGWMAQEAGDDAAAGRWTQRAVRLATAGDDREMRGYALVRQAEILLYREDSVGVLALARHAQEHTSDPRVNALAVQREAQGHALAGDETACRRALDRARELMDRAGPAPPGTADEPVLGSTTMRDPLVFVTGWCLHDLGRPRRAAQVLAEEFDRVPPGAHRARARYGARLALALAGDRDIDRACAVSDEVITAMRLVDSATVRSDLRRLVRTMNRQVRRYPQVRRVLPGLADALHSTRDPTG